MHHVRKDVDHLVLNLVSVDAEAAAVEWVSDVVGAVLEEGPQLRVVEILIARVADLLGAHLLKFLQQGGEAFLGLSSHFSSPTSIESRILKSSFLI